MSRHPRTAVGIKVETTVLLVTVDGRGYNGSTGVYIEELGLIMKYIGAKDFVVRSPFVIEGLIIGVFGAAIPLVLLYFLYDKAVEYIMEKFSILQNIIDFLPVGTVYQILLPIGLVMGIGIGFLGSFFTVRKHLKV